MLKRQFIIPLACFLCGALVMLGLVFSFQMSLPSMRKTGAVLPHPLPTAPRKLLSIEAIKQDVLAHPCFAADPFVRKMGVSIVLLPDKTFTIGTVTLLSWQQAEAFPRGYEMQDQPPPPPSTPVYLVHLLGPFGEDPPSRLATGSFPLIGEVIEVVDAHTGDLLCWTPGRIVGYHGTPLGPEDPP